MPASELLASPSNRKGIRFDPRTKLFLLITLCTLILSTDNSGLMLYLKPLLALIPFVLLLLSGGGASASVWNSPGGIAVLCAGAGICVIAYLAMKAMSRLSTDPRNLGGGS